MRGDISPPVAPELLDEEQFAIPEAEGRLVFEQGVGQRGVAGGQEVAETPGESSRQVRLMLISRLTAQIRGAML